MVEQTISERNGLLAAVMECIGAVLVSHYNTSLATAFWRKDKLLFSMHTCVYNAAIIIAAG